MKNWKTLLSGLVAALPYILEFFGVDCSKEATNGLTGLGLTGLAWFTKDKNVTGGTVQQK